MSVLSDDYTLVLEASTYVGSVAALRGAAVIDAREVEMRGRDEERLMPAVTDCVGALPNGIDSVARVVCGAGPGSFTSLRIAAAIAKGICHARGLPLFAVSSLALLAAGSASASAAGRLIVALDAMRDEVYVASFALRSGDPVPAHPAVGIISRSSAEELARETDAVLVHGVPRAGSAARMLDSILGAPPVELPVWEPTYGRDPEAQVKWEAAHGRPLR